MLHSLLFHVYNVISNRRAVTAIEYALIAALIAVVVIGAETSLGKNVSATFNKVSNAV